MIGGTATCVIAGLLSFSICVLGQDLIEAESMVGYYVDDQVVLFNHGDEEVSSAAYSIVGNGVVRHLLCNMAPCSSAYVIRCNGAPIDTVRATVQGTIYFETTINGKANFSVNRYSDVPPDTPWPLRGPWSFSLSPNFPNPFNSNTIISYHIPGRNAASVVLTLFNTAGQVVRTLVSQPQRPGLYRAVWDGRNDSGQEVASGVYFYRLKIGTFRAEGKAVLLR